MVRSTRRVTANGAGVGTRVGVATGEAVSEHGDWFGTPVVQAARLCALAGTDEIWANDLVAVMAGRQADAQFVPLGPTELKGFDEPLLVFRVDPGAGSHRTIYASVAEHGAHRTGIVTQLDYFDRVPAIQRMKSDVVAALAPMPGDVIVDIGCGTGSELVRYSRLVGPSGRVIGVDPSQPMVDEARDRCEAAGIAADLVMADGRATGLPDACCDAVRIERVIQHTGDLAGFMAEAMRITRPGGRIAVADSDWGSLVVHPGARDTVRRWKAGFENGPFAEPWAGRSLHGGLLDAGLQDVSSRAHAVTADHEGAIMRPLMNRFVEARILERAEADTFLEDLDRSAERGDFVYAFMMFVASGRRP